MFAIQILLAVAAQQAPVVHNAVVDLDVAAGTVAIDDTLEIGTRGLALSIELHSGMAPTFEGATVTGSSTDGDVETFALTRVSESTPLRVRASGRIVHAPVQQQGEHQRSFQETIGTIEPRGVYLSPQSRFLPVVLDEERGSPLLVSGRVTVRGLPKGFLAKVEGRADVAADAAAGASSFVQDTPIEGFHVVAGPLVEKKKTLQGVEVKIWLRTADGTGGGTGGGAAPADADALADRYLEVTGQYLALFGDLIGPYPYSEFVLVENFWETGYGMPSFTLLGPQVVRFPFILHTSWPHELLHNWWGNGVFPDGGNWTEGLTAYLADHENDARQGRGQDYRRTTIQKYLDFVAVNAGADGTDGVDFPLEDFRGRFSAASEAVGYGKTLMVFHMLRRHLGDDVFKAGLKHLWKTRRFQRTSFKNVAEAFSVPAGRDLWPFLRPWVTTTGIPSLHLAAVAESQSADKTRRKLTITISQTQAQAPWPMNVPVVISTVDGRSTVTEVVFPAGDGTRSGERRSASVTVPLTAALARVDVDPFFEVFRRLGPDEVPPSLSRALGAKKMLFVLPTLAGKAEAAAWRHFATSLCPNEKNCAVVDDKAVQTLPNDAAVWVLGYASYLRGGAYVTMKPHGIRFDDRGFFGPGGWERVMAGTDAADRRRLYDVERIAPEKTALALVMEHPRNRALAMTFVGAPNASMIEKLERKLPHYGKYGAVGFTGDAADNSLKLQWKAEGSPLSFVAVAGSVISVGPPPALQALPPPFDAAAMRSVVGDLASPRFAGRPPGHAATRAYVVDALKARGLTPIPAAADCAVGACNVVVTIAGRDPTLPRVVVGAHMDHLGTGGATGKGAAIFPGADDNASGVAVLLEVASQLKSGGARGVDVVFFDGEEGGRLGSKAYVAALAAATPARKVMAMVNLDTVGRRGEGKPFLILDGDSASEWVHIARGVGFTTGVQAVLAPQGGGASDQQSFREAGIPAIQIFSGPHADYHKVSDTAAKVEGASLVDAAVLAREIVVYLRDRLEPLSAPGASGPAAASASGGSSTVRRAALGSMPDMQFPGPGVRFSGVSVGSGAEKAGLREGDVLVRFDGQPVSDLRAYSELLKGKAPGDVVVVVVRRADRDLEVKVTLGAR
jgi:hypothetical protein